MPVLTRTLATAFTVGSNRRGAASGAGWLYALPRLSHERTVCVGSPRATTLAALARASASLVVVSRRPQTGAAVRAAAARESWEHVGVVSIADPSALRGLGPVDLLVVLGRRVRSRRVVEALLAALGPDGLAYLEPGLPRGLLSRGGAATAASVALTPAHGEVRTIVPTADVAMQAELARMGLHGTVLQRPKLARWERSLTHRLPALAVRRTAVVAGPGAGLVEGVPRYLQDLASAAGHDLSTWRYGVSARGDYDSQKVLVLLARPDCRPTAVVKVTRSARHADRLLNETSVLEQLSEVAAAGGRVPVVLFAGASAGRQVLGQSLLDGRPMAVASDLEPVGGQLEDALRWLVDLAAETARPAPGSLVAESLLRLLERFEQTYRLTGSQLQPLRDAFEQLPSAAPVLPTVLQHGDPGIWNLLVDADGRTLFLDWESAEPDGLPLWDLLYCFRSYAVEVGRRQGVRDPVRAAARHLLDTSALSDLLVRVTDDYCRRLGIPAAALDALAYGCWMHRALKDSSRLSPATLHTGHSLRLLQELLARPQASALRRVRA